MAQDHRDRRHRLSGIWQTIVWFGAVFGWLWIAALPVFLLVWLNRSRVKAEIASW